MRVCTHSPHAQPDVLDRWHIRRHELNVLEKMQMTAPKQGEDRMVEWQYGDSRGWIWSRLSMSDSPRDQFPPSPPACPMSTFDANGDSVAVRVTEPARIKLNFNSRGPFSTNPLGIPSARLRNS